MANVNWLFRGESNSNRRIQHDFILLSRATPGFGAPVERGNTFTVHPGHGASGPPSILYEDERIYLRTCRKIAAEEIARSGFTEAAKQAAVERINARFLYINPPGIKDIVRSSVDGLFQELSLPNEAPVR